ncbi:DUF418 domain-containing protein [Cytobacillus horneckiae]|uniref:DUF418 domain-containing protein n=1 Tax=Cytobacillus horneckiae TaxID=549687 RepID=UPI00203E1067|nr:DUF418 domain-containing protein [Cytobacillus horneckiae]MCM3180634.1 DUF418 domain-containing protein [Cytobacillus horneckiae]
MFAQQGNQLNKKRAISLDLARGLMLLLIALAHAPLYLYGSQPGIMSRPESVHFLDNIINSFGELFIDNRARPLFAVIFGYGLVLMFESQLSKGKNIKEAKRTIRKRSYYLILFGMILAVFIGGQDILMAYGVAGLLVGWLLSRDHKVFISATVIVTVLFLTYLPFLWGFILQEIGSYGFGTEFSQNDNYLQSLLEAALYFPIVPIFIHLLFPILPSVLIGIWFGRKHLLTEAQKQDKKLKRIASFGITISILGALPIVLIDEVWEPSLFLTGFIYGIQIITGTAGGIGYAALFGMIGNRLKNPNRITTSLTALGKRSLTFFVLNETLLVLLLSPAAFGLGDRLSNTGVTVIAIIVWGLSVILATILEKHQMKGPLETLMRSLVYNR